MTRSVRVAFDAEGDSAKSRIALDHLACELRPLTRPPKLCDVRDSITQGSAIIAGAALDRSRYAHEFCAHLFCGQVHLGIAMTAEVDEFEMRGEFAIGERPRLLQVTSFCIGER